MSKRRMWTDEEIKLLIKLNEEGKSNQEIATDLGRSKESVNLKRNKLGLVSKYKKASRKIVLNNKEEKILRNLISEGKSKKQIANIMGLTVSVIKSRMKELGIKSEYKPTGNVSSYLYQKGEIVNNTLKVVEQTRDKIGKAYIVQSLKYCDAPVYTVSEYKLKRGDKDAYLKGRRIYEGNSLYSVEYLRPHIINIEYSKTIARYHSKPVLFKCDNLECDHTKMMSPSDLISQGFSCDLCSTNLSYGQLAFGQYQRYFNQNYVAEKQLPNSNGRRSDFVKYHNNKIIEIVEIQGIQHTDVNHKWYEESHEQDVYKRKYCKQNDIKMIEIDMRVSSWGYFKEQINKCKHLPSINEKDEKEILKLMEVNSKYPIKKIINMYENGLSPQKIANELGYTRFKVASVLNRIGIC